MKEAGTGKAASKALLLQRREQAETMAQSKTSVVTLKIPGDLNEWLDRYRHHSYPNRIEKQTLVTEALKLLFLSRGEPGSPVVAVEDAVIGKISSTRGKKSKKG